MAKKFETGLVTGILTTLGTLGAALFAYKKRVIDPEKEKEAEITTNRKKANRKSHSAHQG